MDPLRQAEVRNFASSNGLCLIGLLEIEVSESLFSSISTRLLSGWNWVANYDFSHRDRIWVGWNLALVTFEVLSFNSQTIHGSLKFLVSGLCCYVSTVYADHAFIARRPLWVDLVQTSALFQVLPWLVVGDFNAIRDLSDQFGGSDTWIPYFDEFNRCLTQSELEDLRYIGFRYT